MQKYSFKHVHKIRCLSISTYTSLKAHNSLVQTKYCITYKRKWQTCCNLHCNFLNSYNIHFRKNLMFSPAQKLSNVSHHKGYNATFKVPSEETLFHNYPPPSRFGETGWELSCAPVFKFDSAVSFHFICLLKFQIHLSLLLCLMICILIYLICTLCSLVTCNECLLCIHNSVCKSSKNPCSQKNVWRQLSLRYFFFQGRPSMSLGSLNSIGNLIQCPS